MTDPLRDLHSALTRPTPDFHAAHLHLPAGLTPEQIEVAAALALQWGSPRAALAWSRDPLRRAAAHLRLGDHAAARTVLARQGEGARAALLRARAAALEGAADWPERAALARTLARQEGDSAALIAAVTLMAEGQQSDPYAALRTLAEGLKVAEIAGQSADPHLLAVLAHTQARLNPRKAQVTAARALDRSAPRSPARVLALLALARPDEAQAEAQAGELHPGWWAFSAEFRSTEAPAQDL